MNIQQIRNATLRVQYADALFLIDPWLCPKGSMGSFAQIPEYRVREEQRSLLMPLCDLPMSAADVLDGVDACIVTHVHPDHVDLAADGTAGGPLDHDLPLFAQSADNAEVFRRSGFSDVRVLAEDTRFGKSHLFRTEGRHGVIRPCGPASGVIFTAPDEPVLFIAGDTIWYEGTAAALRRFQPDVIVLNACAAELLDEGRLIMDDADVASVCDACPEAAVIVSHMDNVAHAALDRTTMRSRLKRRGLDGRVLMPDDGQTMTFSAR